MRLPGTLATGQRQVSPGLSRLLARKASSSSAPKQPETIGDPKKEIIRRTLYPNNVRNTSAPTGTWRPDVGLALQRAIPSVQAHETIERAWLLHKRHVRKQREAELQRKFECMRKAMDVLHEIDPFLYREANKKEDARSRSRVEAETLATLKGSEKRAFDARIRGLFPRELKVPTDTPSRDGWNYEYRPSSRSAK